jgi:hypothetical protein
MIKGVRKKVAESISKVDSPEHYDWNKWLRAPGSEEYHIEHIYSAVQDTDDIDLETVIPSTRGYSIDLPKKIKISKAFKQLQISKHKTNKIFFSFPKTKLSSVDEILSSSEIDFSLSVPDSEKSSSSRQIEPENKHVSEMTGEVLIQDFYPPSPEVYHVPLLPARKVEVHDLFSNLKTEVINVELLNSDNFIDPKKYSENSKIEFQPLPEKASVKNIAIVNLEKLLHSLNEQEKLVKNIRFQQLSSSQMSAVSEIKVPASVISKLKIMTVKNIKVPVAKVRQEIKIGDKPVTDAGKLLSRRKKRKTAGKQQEKPSEDLEEILRPEIKFGKEERERLYDFLYDYQKPAADYLSENKFVLLSDELGSGKTLEVIGALKILFERSDISNAVIVCGKEETGWENRELELSKNSLSGWYDHLREYLPEIPSEKIEQISEKEWEKTSAVKIMSYQVFVESVEKGFNAIDDFNRRGCLIIDEVEDFPETKLNALPKYLWLLSNYSSDDLKDKVSAITGSEEQLVSFGRTKGEVSDSLPTKLQQDYWIEMDSDQKTEYEKALESGRERIYDLVQAGNPFLVQSNIFTLIHQLTQLGNFNGEKASSPKSDLLLRHVKTIQKSGKKVLVFTQYDKQGTQKLEKLFEKNGIKYVVYQTGISLKEMEEAIKSFTKNKSITVFLAGMKAINAKINLAGVSYLIHFDQWWSPASAWNAEERITLRGNKNVNERLNVYNYFVRNSIEEKIRIKLTEKGLINRNLFDLLSSESIYSLITNEEWLELLDLIEPKEGDEIRSDKEKQLQYVTKLTTDDFAHMIKGLMGRIGYKNISIKTAHNPDEVRLFCTAIKNSSEVKTAVQCLNTKLVTKKVVKDFADSLVVGTDRILIFTTGEFDKKLPRVIEDERVVLIDKQQVSKYLFLFNLV